MPIDAGTVRWDAPQIDPNAVKWDAPSVALADVPELAVQNLPADAAAFAGNLYTAVTNPVQTLGGALDIVRGGVRAARQAVLPESASKYLDSFYDPEYVERISSAAKLAGGQLAENYGSWEAIKRSIAFRPVQTAADLSTILTGGALATARVAPGASNMLARAATATDPLMQTVRAGAAGVNALRAAPGVVQTVVPRALEPLVAPEAVTLNKIIEAGGGAEPVLNALRQTQDMRVTPGAPAPSLSERMIASGAPNIGLAKLEAGVAANAPEAGQQIFQLQQQRLSAIQGQLARVEQQIQSQAAALAPADLTRLRGVRDDLLRQIADEQRTLANTAEGVAQPLPTVRQQDVGGAIQQRAKELDKEFTTNVIRPAFQAAFDKDAPTPSIDLSQPFAGAERLLSDVGVTVDPSRVSPAVRNLLRIEPYEPSLGVAPVVSLEDFQSIRSVLGEQARSVADTDRVRSAALRSVIRQMDDALRASDVPAEAQKLYGEARRLVREEQVPRFRTGETGKMLSTTRFNMPGTLPSRQVEAFLKNEDATTQFVDTYRGDPRALQSLQQGILDLYRRDIVNPATRAVDPPKAAAFEAKYARQLDTLEAAGLNVRDTMQMVQRDATAVQQGLETLAAEAKKFKRTPDANAVVDLALKSPMEMRFVRDRLTPPAREALAGELVNRATTAIERGDAQAALKYLTDNRKTLRVGLGKEGAKTYDDLVGLARFQQDLADVAKQAPKTDILTPVQLSRTFTPAELTDLKVVADDLKRMRQVEELGTPPDAAAKRLASEQAAQIGTRAADAPAYFTPVYTTIKKAVQKLEERVNRKAVAYAVDVMYRDPDKLIPLLEEAIALKTKTARPASLAVPAGVERGARALTGAGVAGQYVGNAMAAQPQQNQNALSR